MDVSAQKVLSRLLLLIFLLVNSCQFVSGSDVQGDCSKDGSCEGQEKHGKQKYIVKGISLKLIKLAQSHFCFNICDSRSVLILLINETVRIAAIVCAPKCDKY